MMMTGNGILKKKIATNDAPAIATRSQLRRVRLPIRTTALTTIATTAACRPNSNPAIHPTLP